MSAVSRTWRPHPRPLTCIIPVGRPSGIWQRLKDVGGIADVLCNLAWAVGTAAGNAKPRWWSPRFTIRGVRAGAWHTCDQAEKLLLCRTP
jgi:hypothetical protein